MADNEINLEEMLLNPDKTLIGILKNWRLSALHTFELMDKLLDNMQAGVQPEDVEIVVIRQLIENLKP